jgi:26S proteasome non-ATPase regulatory subunit 10
LPAHGSAPVPARSAAARALLLQADADGRTALHWSASGKREDVASWILASLRDEPAALAAALRARDGSGAMPLLCAASAGSAALIRAFVEAGADATAKNDEGNAPLHYHKGRAEIVDALIAAGASANVAGAAGVTPLHRAAGRPGGVGAVRALLRGGARVSAPDAAGDTPLH